jgi:hypothetical protein
MTYSSFSNNLLICVIWSCLFSALFCFSFIIITITIWIHIIIALGYMANSAMNQNRQLVLEVEVKLILQVVIYSNLISVKIFDPHVIAFIIFVIDY